MGCSASKPEDEEAVKLCKDRKNYIKQAMECRNRLASGHTAYIQSMRRVSFALMHSAAAEDVHEFLSDSYTTPPFTPVKGLSPEIRSIPLKSCTPAPDKMVRDAVRTVNYLRSGENQSVTVEEWPEPRETVQIESYYPMESFTVDDFFASPNNRASQQSPSPRSSRWDYFWNPFSSMDSYGYPTRNSFGRIVSEDDIAGMRQVREAEGIPELEEDIDDDDEIEGDDDDYDDDHDDDHDDDDDDNNSRNRQDVMFWNNSEGKKKTSEAEFKNAGVQVGDPSPVHVSGDTQKIKELQSKSKVSQSIEASRSKNEIALEAANKVEVKKIINAEETPGFTVYVNRRPASMVEVMMDMKNQFIRICDCAHEVSIMLEANKFQYSVSNEAVRKLKPVALFRTSPHSSPFSKFFKASSDSKGEAYESCSDYSEECCMVSGSHKSTLDRLYAWEKKLYEEVKCGERVRMAYEKKCMQLKNHDINGDDPSVVDKTRVAIRDLHTRLKILIHTVESISKRIEVLRDGELHPQIMEIIQGLSRMWKTMADCHRIQKRTIDEAKLLLFSGSSGISSSPQKPPNTAANLAAELGNWRCSFGNWIDAQRSYVRALAGWASRCAPANADDESFSGDAHALSPLSPLRSHGEVGGVAPEVVRLCSRWSQLVESVSEERAVDGMDFFAAGIASISAQQREILEEAAAAAAAEVGPRVLCAGLSVAVGSLAELAVVYSEGYDSLVRSCCGRGEDGTVAADS